MIYSVPGYLNLSRYLVRLRVHIPFLRCFEVAIDISQNIHSYWQLGSLEDKKKIQKLVFPEGVVIDTKKRTYLTSKVNSLFLLKSRFSSSCEGINKKLPTKNGEESYLVDKRFEISNLDLIKEMVNMVNLELV